MKREWLKKIGLGMMLTLALGTAACGAGQDFDDSDEIENFVNQGNGAAEDEGQVFFFDGGSITDTGDGLSASFDDGSSFVGD